MNTLTKIMVLLLVVFCLGLIVADVSADDINVTDLQRPKAVTTLAQVNQTDYNTFIDTFGNQTVPVNASASTTPDWDPWVHLPVDMWGDSYEGFGWLFLFSLPFIAAWIRQSASIIPMMFGFIAGPYILLKLPASFHLLAIAFLALSITAIIYAAIKKRT